MRSIKELWQLSRKEMGLKVRFQYWNHEIKFFEIQEYDEELKAFHGLLDNGESISYSEDILDWDIYMAGDEFAIRVA